LRVGEREGNAEGKGEKGGRGLRGAREGGGEATLHP